MYACPLKHASEAAGIESNVGWTNSSAGSSNGRVRGHRAMGIELHMRSSMELPTAYEILARRRCLVCEFRDEVWESEATDEIGPLCSRCHAPTERTSVEERRRAVKGVNPHAAALGRLGGLKGGPARAAGLTPQRRRAIARAAARARWSHRGSRGGT
jgi:hypothetical protein